MKWVTWQHIGVDRMACIWLIKRKIDPEAEFIFIPAALNPCQKEPNPSTFPGHVSATIAGTAHSWLCSKNTS